MQLDSLDLFSPDLVASIGSTSPTEQDGSVKVARAARHASRIQARRAKSEAHLAEILPERFSEGDSWHVISHGDIDSLSYLIHAMRGTSHFDHVLISTWCMARPDIEQLCAWLDAGKIDQLDLYVGEIFPNQYGDEYALCLEMASTYNARLVVARNHSKVMLMAETAGDYYLVSESSANVNPRIEQTSITASRDLYAFYAEFFGGLKSIDRRHRG